ncbi:hypothetical protein [Ascidiaceihabitans sp.]|uniref:hypothetical protein n=1 Tax=Ascidiaceihabitans sp. TaxID=1872644 RepID=UPI00329740E9
MNCSSFLVGLICLFLSAASVNANRLNFSDNSGYGNFVVVWIDQSGQERLLQNYEGDFSISLEDFSVGERVSFGVKFFLPNAAGSENFEVQKASLMQVGVELVITESLKKGFTIPVFYFDCIGRCGFDQIDPIQKNIPDRLFEQYFKSALMAEHYYLRLGTTDSPAFRRSVQLWRDSSYLIGSRKFDWWRMTSEIMIASQTAFADFPEREAVTNDYHRKLEKQ